MKRIFVLFAATVATITSMSAQVQLPNDPEVRKGQLDNGLTYYIRHNEKPQGRAEFYLATHVGAIQETPEQDGLAHFLEHMCFNGLKNLPGKQMLEYLQSIGAEFGRNINAGTGVEYTTYMLNNIPVIREGIIDTCLLVMHDYSHFVTCDPAEIDKERGVIIEEKRQGNNAARRMREKAAKYYYKDSKYADCTIIGSQENLETFRPESLVDFYHTWYRPDLQAVIVVGDIDPDQIETKLRDLFSDIPAVENPEPKTMPVIPDNEDPIVGIITDPEASATSITILWKGKPEPVEYNSTDVGFISDLLKDLISIIMEERLSDISANPDAPFINAGFSISNLAETCEAVLARTVCKDGKSVAALKALYTEIEKMRRFGFTEAEVQRAKDNILRMYEKQVEGAESRKNGDFVKYYINNFFKNTPYMTPDTELKLASPLCANISAQLINQIAAQTIPDPMENLVIVYQAPEKEGLVHPSETDLLATIEDVLASDIKANAEEDNTEPLLDTALLKGSAVTTESKGIYGSTQWTLENGVKVIVLPTEYKKDQVVVNLRMNGGETLISNKDLVSFEENVIALFNRNRGVSKFPKTRLTKMLAGKAVNASPYISELYHGISATSSPKDIETAFQLLYLGFTDQRFDPDEFNNGINQIKAILPNLKSQPNFIFQEQLVKTLFGNNPRAISISDETVDKASLATIEKVYKKLYKNAAGATVFIVGNVDLESLKPLVEKYIGSLPKGKKATSWIAANALKPVKGKIENIFETTMQTPMNTVLQIWSGDIKYSIEKDVMLSAASYILDMIYTETLREEEGGTYGVSSRISVDRSPEEYAIIQVNFNTNPDQVDKLRSLAIQGLENLANNGPTEEQLTRTIENFKKNVPEQRITNGYWIKALRNYNEFGEDWDSEYEAAVGKINAESIQAALQEILRQGNFIEVVMGPKAAEE